MKNKHVEYVLEEILVAFIPLCLVLQEITYPRIAYRHPHPHVACECPVITQTHRND